MSNKLRQDSGPVTDVKRSRPVRVRLQVKNYYEIRPYPPDGLNRDWWQRLKNALGTVSSDFVYCSLMQLIAAAKLPGGPMECQINTQSAPDAVDLSQIVTLVSHKYVKTLRHGIYEHDNCAKAISEWVRSRLGAPACEVGDCSSSRARSVFTGEVGRGGIFNSKILEKWA